MGSSTIPNLPVLYDHSHTFWYGKFTLSQQCQTQFGIQHIEGTSQYGWNLFEHKAYTCSGRKCSPKEAKQSVLSTSQARENFPEVQGQSLVPASRQGNARMLTWPNRIGSKNNHIVSFWTILRCKMLMGVWLQVTSLFSWECLSNNLLIIYRLF